MPNMSKTALIADLKGMLGDAGGKFTAPADSDFARHLDIAAFDMGRFRPRTMVGSVTLVADQANYAAPADLVRIKCSLWGLKERSDRRPWEPSWPGRLPALSLAESGGTREIWLDPAPTAAQISNLGSTYRFYYFAGHAVADVAANTTVRESDRSLLLIRAVVQALQELANRGVAKPVQLGDGFGSMPKNGTPGALAEVLLEQFERMAA